MIANVVLGVICLTCLTEFIRADSISNFIISDKDGKNTCIADLHCFLSLDRTQNFDLSFDLTLDKDTEKAVYKVVIEQTSHADIMKKELVLCYDDSSKVATLAAQCDNSHVPSGTYHISYAIDIPVFKDVASMIISGPNGAEGFRGVVSTLSSQPPIQLCNPHNGAC